MKKILILIVLICSFFLSKSQTPQTIYIEPNIAGLQGYFGNANRIFVIEKSEEFVLCPSCIVDSINIFQGVGGRIWLKLTDSIKGEYPIRVRTDTLTGTVIIYQVHPDGVEPGTGIVTWSGTGLIYEISPVIYWIAGVQYLAPANTVTLDPADATFSRQDIFIVNTSGVSDKKTGVPAAFPVEPQPNETELALTSGIQLNVGDLTPTITQLITIYDENLGSPTEWAISTGGTLTLNSDNTNNPYHLTKAQYISSYNSGARIIYTSASVDSFKNEEVLRLWVYLNVPLGTNSLRFQFYLGNATATNSISVNNTYGLNPNLTNQYQLISIPLNAFTKTSQTFDRLRITFIGTDNSGTGGLYLDYIQLQTGLFNIPPQTDYSNKVDSVTIVSGSDYYWIKGVPHLIGVRGAGGITSLQEAFDKSTSNGDNPTIDGNGNYLGIENLNSFLLSSKNGSDSVSIISDVANKYMNLTANSDAQQSTIRLGADSLNFDNEISLYATNGISGHFSSFRLGQDGSLNILETDGIAIKSQKAGSGIVDLALADSVMSMQALSTVSNRKTNMNIYPDSIAFTSLAAAIQVPVKMKIKVDSSNANANNIAWFDSDNILHRGFVSVERYIAKTATYTATADDRTINCTSGTFTVTLPTSVGITGRVYIITNSGAGTITVGTTTSQTFTNVTATPTTLTMATVGTRMVQSDGANWLLISSL